MSHITNTTRVAGNLARLTVLQYMMAQPTRAFKPHELAKEVELPREEDEGNLSPSRIGLILQQLAVEGLVIKLGRSTPVQPRYIANCDEQLYRYYERFGFESPTPDARVEKLRTDERLEQLEKGTTATLPAGVNADDLCRLMKHPVIQALLAQPLDSLRLLKDGTTD